MIECDSSVQKLPKGESEMRAKIERRRGNCHYENSTVRMIKNHTCANLILVKYSYEVQQYTRTRIALKMKYVTLAASRNYCGLAILIKLTKHESSHKSYKY